MEIKLKNELEYRCTRNKPRWLEERDEALKAEPDGDPKLRELSVRSYARLIKPFREEIISYRVFVLGLPGVAAIRSGQMDQ